MQIRIYSIPIEGGDSILDDMNGFLRSHKVIEIRKEFSTGSNGTCWTFCITYLLNGSTVLERKEKIDYKQVLDENTFSRFSSLRAIRKQLAEQDAVPAYSVFTDAELAEFAKMNPLTISSMKKVDGVGSKRIDKYGEIFINQFIKENEASRIPDGTNMGDGESIQSIF